MELYNLKGELVTSIQTRSGTVPVYIAVTTSGDLVDTVYKDRSSVNIEEYIYRQLSDYEAGDIAVVPTLVT